MKKGYNQCFAVPGVHIEMEFLMESQHNQSFFFTFLFCFIFFLRFKRIKSTYQVKKWSQRWSGRSAITK